jgi:alpha-galactosidase
MHLRNAILFTVVMGVPALLAAQDSGGAKTPPMGWNSWNHFAAKIDDATVRAQADAMVDSGMRDAGYTFINIDDTWEKGRDAEGNILPNEKFPDMKALADYVHRKGLKLGIYSSPGPKTCAEYEGSYKHEEQDAQTYANWGIDYLKYDWCSAEDIPELKADMKGTYRKMADALKKRGRPIVLSFCQYGYQNVWRWGADAGGNLWRTTGDIEDNYRSMAYIGFGQNGLEKYAGPGHWNDPDMLEIGNGGMNADEYRTHMSLWALLAAPLLAGNDLTKIDATTLELLTNREVIAIDQDPLGKQGYRVWQEGPLEIWMKPLRDGSIAVGMFNRGYTISEMKLPFSLVGIKGKAAVRDVWKHQELGESSEEFTTTVPRHGVVMLRIRAAGHLR